MNRQWVIPLGLFAIAMVQGRAIAHGVHLQSQTTQAIELKARFSSGKPMSHAQVSIYAPGDAETPWQTGTTDTEGRFLFVPDPAQTGNWLAKVRRAGHGDAIAIAIGPTDLETAAQATVKEQVDSISTTPADGESLQSIERPPARPPAPHHPSHTHGTAATSQYSFLQKGLMMVAILWGCIGTALFFKRRH